MKRLTPLLFLPLLLLLACKTSPQVVEKPPAVIAIAEEPVIVMEPEEQSVGYSASQELHDRTLAEVQLFIENLNVTISNKNYNEWRAALSDEFFAEISSPEFLRRQNESQLLKARNIQLKTPNDYFLQVVVPSRVNVNSHVDDIELIDANNVKAYSLGTVSGKTERLRLFELTKVGNEWKIKS